MERADFYRYVELRPSSAGVTRDRIRDELQGIGLPPKEVGAQAKH